MAYFETIKVEGFMEAMQEMHYHLPKNQKSDSYIDNETNEFIMGPKDNQINNFFKSRGQNWTYNKYIQVWVKITAPMYWWEEFLKYNTILSINELSPVKTILKKGKITKNDIDYPTSWKIDEANNEEINNFLDNYLKYLNSLINLYLNNTAIDFKSVVTYQLDSLIPRGYKETKIVCLNYNTLNLLLLKYKYNEIDHWASDFINWINSLPYSLLLIHDGTYENVFLNENPYNTRREIDVNFTQSLINTAKNENEINYPGFFNIPSNVILKKIDNTKEQISILLDKSNRTKEENQELDRLQNLFYQLNAWWTKVKITEKIKKNEQLKSQTSEQNENIINEMPLALQLIKEREEREAEEVKKYFENKGE